MLVTGLEPAFTVPFTVTCSVDKPDYTSIKADASRFEQEITDLETVVLPLILCIYKYILSPDRFELSTLILKGLCYYLLSYGPLLFKSAL